MKVSWCSNLSTYEASTLALMDGSVYAYVLEVGRAALDEGYASTSQS